MSCWRTCGILAPILLARCASAQTDAPAAGTPCADVPCDNGGACTDSTSGPPPSCAGSPNCVNEIPAGSFVCDCGRTHSGPTCTTWIYSGGVATPPPPAQTTGCAYGLQIALILQMSDAGGDGWNGIRLVIAEHGSPASILDATVPIGSGTAVESLCYVPSLCYDVTVGSGRHFQEISWNLAFANGTTMMQGGAPFTGQIGSCVCHQTAVTVMMTDNGPGPDGPSSGDGWNDNKMTLTAAGSDSRFVLSLTADDRQTIDLVDMNVKYEDVCLPVSSCYMLEVGGGSFQNEVAWSLLAPDGSLMPALHRSAGSGAPVRTAWGSNCIHGCTDPAANNWNARAHVNTNDHPCTYNQGCMDAYAQNFDPVASQDDGSCTYVLSIMKNNLGFSGDVAAAIYGSTSSFVLQAGFTGQLQWRLPSASQRTTVVPSNEGFILQGSRAHPRYDGNFVVESGSVGLGIRFVTISDQGNGTVVALGASQFGIKLHSGIFHGNRNAHMGSGTLAGSVVHALGGVVEMLDSRFDRNLASGSDTDTTYGGVLFAVNSPQVVVRGCEFVSNIVRDPTISDAAS